MEIGQDKIIKKVLTKWATYIKEQKINMKLVDVFEYRLSDYFIKRKLLMFSIFL